jgi:tetratricopeptide (TPR) repeat protein
MNQTSDYRAELARIDEEITALEPGAPKPAADTDRAKRLAYCCYQRASLRADFAALEAVGEMIDGLIVPSRLDPDLCFLKANLDFKFHRLDAVRCGLKACAQLRDSAQGRALRADLDFQEGRYEQAEAGYEAVVCKDLTWDNLARLAHLRAKMGDMESADQLFEQAEDELTAKEMRHYSWIQLQRGLLDISRGRHADAWAHYERADRAYSGHWMVAEHKAELLAARGDCDAAVGLYEQVVAEVPRPEFQQALGELYAFMGRTDDAEPWFTCALDAYLASAARGEVHYYHHLADFYADVRVDGKEALKWAHKDLELRENFTTRAAMAWALYRAGRFTESLDAMECALASGVVDAHLFGRAARIRRAATGGGDEFLRMAEELNPHWRGFHVHR